MYREELRDAKLVATPGCYPTATVLALAPLAERGLLGDVFVTAMQGTSGYGRSSDDLVHFSAMTENAFPYKTEGHRHRPEIEQELAALGSPAPVTFVPHLLPLDQGELATCFAQPSEPTSREAVQALYRERYADEPFVHVLDWPAEPARGPRHERVPRLRDGRGARPGDRLRGDRQHLEGRLRPGRAEPQPDAGPGRDRGPEIERLPADASGMQGFFRSRWVEAPAGRRGARPGPARARLPRRRRPLRPQGRRQDRRRPASSATAERSPRRWS